MWPRKMARVKGVEKVFIPTWCLQMPTDPSQPCVCVHLLHLVQIVGAPVVNVMAEGSSKHGKGFEIRKVFL